MDGMENKRIQEELEKGVQDGVYPGCVVYVRHLDERYQDCFGYKQLEPVKEKNSLTSLYDLASLSKVVSTTSCILHLLDEGAFTLDTPVQKLLPLFRYDDVTILNLLNHTSGLPADIKGYRQLDNETLIHQFYTVDKAVPTGTQVLYSDINFILLGYLIDQLKGSLPTYAQTILFGPCGMKDTQYNPPKGLKERCVAEEITQDRGLVRGVVHDGKCFKLGGATGHAGLFSTIEDISHFVDMLLDGGKINGHTVYSEAALQRIQTSSTPGLNESRSLGWVLSDPHYALGHAYSPTTIYHTGFSGGSILVDFENHLGIALLCNRVHPTRENHLILERRNTIHDTIYQACGLEK